MMKNLNLLNWHGMCAATGDKYSKDKLVQLLVEEVCNLSAQIDELKAVHSKGTKTDDSGSAIDALKQADNAIQKAIAHFQTTAKEMRDER